MYILFYSGKFCKYKFPPKVIRVFLIEHFADSTREITNFQRSELSTALNGPEFRYIYIYIYKYNNYNNYYISGRPSSVKCSKLMFL